jgi:hypothetical protein
VLTATAFAADSDIVLTMGNSAGPGWAASLARFFARVFFSVGGAGVANSCARGVSSAMGGGFSLDASVGISTIGSDVRFLGRGVGVAFRVIAGSKSLGEAASWARATCDAPNAILLHRIARRIALWKHIQKLSAAFHSPQSGINSSVYFRSRYFVCFVPALLLLSGRSSINLSGGPRRAACQCR